MANNLRKFQTEADYTAATLTYPAVSWVVSGDTLHYDKVAPPQPHDYSQDYLTFVALENSTFNFWKSAIFDPETGDPVETPDIQYSLDNGSTWTTLSGDGETQTAVQVTAGNKILWKGELVADESGMGVGSFAVGEGSFNAEGNIMSIISGDSFTAATAMTASYQLANLFRLNYSIVSAENLVLPATTLSDYCYRAMFNMAGMLETAPVLSAATLTIGCYEMMFEDCSSLTAITCLATDISADGCTNSWVNGVASSGTFTKAASMSDWTTGIDGIPSGWTVLDA